KLSVNVNAVAYLRNRRELPWPDPVALARIALEAGARGITIHPRPDERHIRRTDVGALATMMRDRFPDRDLTLEGYPDDEFLSLVEAAHPQQVLFVPDAPDQVTSDHGWNLDDHADRVAPAMETARSLGAAVSLFIDPEPHMAERAAVLGAQRIEIFTGPYGACHADRVRADAELQRVVRCAEAARDAGLGVNAGHDLTLDNLEGVVERIPFIREVSIGHAFVACALEVGFREAVLRFRRALGEANV
ncbi:MAG: pyridoxine 5'-phosphate synthase, partial [Myxococcota bacterium]